MKGCVVNSDTAYKPGVFVTAKYMSFPTPRKALLKLTYTVSRANQLTYEILQPKRRFLRVKIPEKKVYLTRILYYSRKIWDNGEQAFDFACDDFGLQECEHAWLPKAHEVRCEE